MPKYFRTHICAFLLVFGLFGARTRAGAMFSGDYGRIQGTVRDGTSAYVAAVKITLRDQATGRKRLMLSDAEGNFQMDGVPAGNYELITSAPGFEPSVSNAIVRSSAPIQVRIVLQVAGAHTTIDVSGNDSGQLDQWSSAHSILDKSVLGNLPIQNQATGVSELVTRTTPGVAADGNGFAHPLGEHADTSFSLDNQPITDQQAKIFSNQISSSIIETMEVITGAPPAEYGDKTSLIINVTTQSGLGKGKASGSFSSEYGSFGSWAEGVTYGTGSSKWGNFSALHVSGSGRFLDTPEFEPMHDKGNAESIFDRLDWRPADSDQLHLNVSSARSWFQTPNTYDAQGVEQDQRSQIRSFNIAPGWTHLLNADTLLTLNPFIRFDQSQYFPSDNPMADLPATLAQSRYLLNAGFRGDLAYSRGRHNAKVGVSYWHTLLRESFYLGLTDPSFNAVCLGMNGAAVADARFQSETQCEAAVYRNNPGFIANLLPYDLSRNGRLYPFQGSAEIKELAFYAQDSIRLGRLTVNPGLRYDRYNGLSQGHQLQPRFGLAWRAPVTNTILRLSYARLFETPYNENLIISSKATTDNQGSNPFGTFRSSPPQPGKRNQFNTGLAQGFGKHLSLDTDYFWKFTKNAFDFDSLFLTPVTFPIGWRKSKIDGLAARLNFANFHGLSAYTVMGHTRSRFFGPELGGLVFNSVPANGVFRIDHSEEFEQTTSVRYQHGKSGPWASFTWRFNSGLALPGVVPNYASALAFTADEQAQMGLYCGNTFATRFSPITSCTSTTFGATRISIPPDGKENDDLRPTRVSARNLFDVGMGVDNLLHTERSKTQVRLNVLNLANSEALYNFLSTFSGTHFVAPRTLQVEMRVVF